MCGGEGGGGVVLFNATYPKFIEFWSSRFLEILQKLLMELIRLKFLANGKNLIRYLFKLTLFYVFYLILFDYKISNEKKMEKFICICTKNISLKIGYDTFAMRSPTLTKFIRNKLLFGVKNFCELRQLLLEK